MDCQTVKQELVAFLDNEVAPPLKVQIETHLKGCQDCTQEMRALQASWQMLDRNLPPAPGPDFTASVMNRIRSTPKSSAELKPDWVEQLLPHLTVMAVIFAVFLIGLLVWDHLRPTMKVSPKHSPLPLVEPKGRVLTQREEEVAPVVPETIVESNEVIPAKTALPQVIQTLPKINPPIVPQVIPVAPVAVSPMMVKLDQDQDIIANLDIYENAEMLEKMDVVSDMDVVASMKETS